MRSKRIGREDALSLFVFFTRRNISLNVELPGLWEEFRKVMSQPVDEKEIPPGLHMIAGKVEGPRRFTGLRPCLTS